MTPILIRLHRPEGYHDVHPELILQDAKIDPAFQPELVEPPPECQTEAEKIAYAFGWWKAMEARQVVEPPRLSWSLDEAASALLHTMTGDENPEHATPVTLYVGESRDDDGKPVYGLHAYESEYPEEGVTPLVEFAAPAVQVVEPLIEQITPENRHAAALEDGQVVEPLTEGEAAEVVRSVMLGDYSDPEPEDLEILGALVRACARKWGLTIKEPRDA